MIAYTRLSLMTDSDSPPPVSADRGARRATAGALAAELGHDLQGPLNLFRLMTERLERGQTLDAEDASLLREELNRLSALNARLRELARIPIQKSSCTPVQLIELALGASLPLHTGAWDSKLQLDLSQAEGVGLMCDAGLVGRALRELIDNALEARTSRAGVRFQAGLGFCVWDDGPALQLDLGQAARFGKTTRDGAAGLGLTLALRVARAHGFGLELRRTGTVTEAWLLVFNASMRSRDAETKLTR